VPLRQPPADRAAEDAGQTEHGEDEPEAPCRDPGLVLQQR
jgi:hypothetical protein